MSHPIARVDDRLIHGQVIHGWVPKLGTKLIVVADRRVSDSSEEQLIARMAVPAGVEVRFVHPSEAAGASADDATTLVLFRTPVDALEAIDAGFEPERLNLGNLHFEPGKLQLRKTFCCSRPELDALRTIATHGIAIDYQPAPDIKRVALDLDALSA